MSNELKPRLEELAAMFEADAERTLQSEAAHCWFEGKRYPVRDKVDWALGQIERAKALRALAKEQPQC